MSILDELRVKPRTKMILRDRDATRSPGASNKARAERLLEENREKLGRLQYRLWAENSRSLLVVLQGIDTAGKDGVVRKVLTGMNPEGCKVTSFKKPSEIELDHDFLWRIHKAVPARGEVGVFNRSHYEDVLVVRVHNHVPEKVWRPRYETINAFERSLAVSGTTIVKFFLHISKAEQKERLQARLADPEKQWKFTAQDIEERKLWDDYIAAYQDMLSKCNTPEAPWHVVPSDKKWYRNWAVSEILVRTLEQMDPKLPAPKVRAQDFAFE